jgi:hypothetical protein
LICFGTGKKGKKNEKEKKVENGERKEKVGAKYQKSMIHKFF